MHQPEADKTYGNVEAIEFLLKLRPPPWILVAIATDGPITTAIARNTSDIDMWVNTFNGKCNLYFQLNPSKLINKKPTRDDITAVEYFHADLDPVGNETPEEAKARYQKQLNNGEEPVPTFLIDTGNGLQGIWKRAIVQPLGEGPERDAAVTDAEARNRRLVLHLGCDDASTRDISRILRLPGTINLPTKAKREKGRVACPSTLLAFNDVTHSDEVFPPWKLGSVGPDDPGPEPKEGAHESELSRIIRTGDSSKWNGNRSHAVFWVACEMVRMGCEDSMIVSTLLDPTNGISAHVREQHNPTPRAYALRQVARAREKNPQAQPKSAVVLPESQWHGEAPAVAPPALIKDVLPETGVAMIGGQSGSGKTFIALHLAGHLIPQCNQQFYIDKYRIKRHGGVICLVLEGRPSFPMRMTAMFEAMMGKQMNLGDREKLPFAWNAYEPDLFTKGPGELIKLAQRDAVKMRQDFEVDPVAIFIDTMGLAACYENEDKAAQVQRVVKGLFKLSDETGALVIGVDHYGKDQSAGLRGTSAKRGHVETILACLVDRDKEENPINRRMKLEKIRDGEEGRIIPYRLKPIDWGVDEDGDHVSTCVVEWEINRPQPKKEAPKRRKTKSVLEQAIHEVGGLPANCDALREEFYKLHGGNRSAANMAFHRAIESMGLKFVGDRLDLSL